jgi:hypothetical protein
MQAVDPAATLPLLPLEPPRGERQRLGKYPVSLCMFSGLATDVADHLAELHAQCSQCPTGAFEWFRRKDCPAAV